ERRAASNAFTVDAYGSAMQLHELPDNGEPETHAASTPRALAGRLPTTLEHVRQELRADSLPRVGHGHFHLQADAFDRHVDASAFGGELDGVGEEVPDHLMQPAD